MDKQTFYSVVQTADKQQKLLVCCLFGAAGLFLWFYSVLILQQWNIFLFLGGLLLIYAGIFPYRRLGLLETKPDRLILTTQKLYYLSGKKERVFLVSDIKKIRFVQKWMHNGIEISFKDEKIFLPYFSKFTAAELEKAIQAYSFIKETVIL